MSRCHLRQNRTVPLRASRGSGCRNKTRRFRFPFLFSFLFFPRQLKHTFQYMSTLSKKGLASHGRLSEKTPKYAAW